MIILVRAWFNCKDEKGPWSVEYIDGELAVDLAA